MAAGCLIRNLVQQQVPGTIFLSWETMMKMFISWSGDLSQRIALHLKEWLPVVLPFLDAWVSSEDIPKGTRWGTELASQLEGTDSGIVCLVPGNYSEPWLNFEAGALSKSVQKTRVHPFLFGFDPGVLKGPLAQFQATRFSKDDVRKLVKAINSEAGAAALPADKVDRSFAVCWPDLERRIAPLLSEVQNSPIPMEVDPAKSTRSDETLTPEYLAVLRAVANSQDGLHPDDAAGMLAQHPQRIQHVMESLEERGLLDAAHNYVHGTSWHLSKGGRKFLVKQGLL